MFNLHAINPGYLAAGAVALAPIILHLLQRRRRQRVVFGSLRFLRKMSQRVVRRRRMTELILIILRVVALLLPALGFARLFFYRTTQRAGSAGAAAEEVVLVLVDNSYSMRHGRRMSRAKDQAKALVDSADPLTRVAVTTFAATLREPVDFDAPARQATKAIDAIEPSWEGTQLGAALERAAEIVRGRAEEVRRIVVIGDFQESAQRPHNQWRLPPGIKLEVRNVADPAEGVANIYVDSVSVPSLVTAGGFAENISARIANHTDKPVKDIAVTLTVAGKVVEQRRVSIKPRSDTAVRFRCAFATSGDVSGQVSVAAKDSLSANDAAFFTVRVAPKIKVLLVNGDPNKQLIRNDGFFLQAALAPAAADRPSPFEVIERTPEKLTPADIDGVEGILLANVDTVSDTVAKALREFLYSGGGVGFVVGAKTDPDRFNKTFRSGAEPIAPAKLWETGVADGDQPVIITWTDQRHDIFRLFAGPRRGDMGVAEFRQYYRLTDSQDARVLARFSNGHPALLEKLCSRPGAESSAGRSLLLASSADLEWNDLCLKGVFVPFVHQFTRRLCAARSGGWARNVEVGEEAILALGEPADEVTLTDPDDNSRKLTVGDDGRLRITPHRPGLYTITHKGGSAFLAANLAPGEADLSPMDTKVLLTAIQPAGDDAPLPGGASLISPRSAKERVERSQKIWICLIAAALAVLAVEMFLGARAGTA